MKTKIQFCLAILIVLIFLFGAFVSTYHSPLIHNSGIISANILPQGWGFFTKSPRDIRVEAYRFNSNKKILKKNASIEYLFGLRRTPSRIAIEIADLVTNAPDSLWVKSKTNAHDFNRGNFVSKSTTFKEPFITGDIVLINAERVPWGWSKFGSSLNPPIVYLKIRTNAK